MSEEETVFVLTDEEFAQCIRNAYNDAGVTFTELKSDVRECGCCFDRYDENKYRIVWQATKMYEDLIPDDVK